MSYSVIIPTIKDIYESHGSIVYTVRSILDQSVPADKIIIVSRENNTSTNEELLRRFENQIQLVTYPSDIMNISYSRNLGASYAESDNLVFMDDDVVLGEYNVAEIANRVLLHFDFCCGAKRLWTPLNWGDYLKELYPIEHTRRILQAVSFCPNSVNRTSVRNVRSYHEYSYIGNFGAIRRNVFEAVNGYDEAYFGWIAEDTDLMMRLCYNQFSYHILANSGVKVYHLSHSVNKEATKNKNRKLFDAKMQSLGVKFSSGNFFGEFNPFSNDFSAIKFL